MNFNDYTVGDTVFVTFDDGNNTYNETGSFVEYDGTYVWVKVDGKIYSFDEDDVTAAN